MNCPSCQSASGILEGTVDAPFLAFVGQEAAGQEDYQDIFVPVAALNVPAQGCSNCGMVWLPEDERGRKAYEKAVLETLSSLNETQGESHTKGLKRSDRVLGRVRRIVSRAVRDAYRIPENVARELERDAQSVENEIEQAARTAARTAREAAADAEAASADVRRELENIGRDASCEIRTVARERVRIGGLKLPDNATIRLRVVFRIKLGWEDEPPPPLRLGQFEPTYHSALIRWEEGLRTLYHHQIYLFNTTPDRVVVTYRDNTHADVMRATLEAGKAFPLAHAKSDRNEMFDEFLLRFQVIGHQVVA